MSRFSIHSLECVPLTDIVLPLGTAHSTSALISARCIHLVIMKSITHCSRGYDFVNSVDMADMEEGEMPVTFYRKKWGHGNAVWGEGSSFPRMHVKEKALVD